MDFSPREEHLLASVGGYPDYMLTVWDWTKQSIVLRTKAFSQEIYRVSFSPKLPGQLTTSGTGHIRFWKMSSTFTGLKLQGYLGKFGQTELSDISGETTISTSLTLSLYASFAGFFVLSCHFSIVAFTVHSPSLIVSLSPSLSALTVSLLAHTHPIHVPLYLHEIFCM